MFWLGVWQFISDATLGSSCSRKPTKRDHLDDDCHPMDEDEPLPAGLASLLRRDPLPADQLEKYGWSARYKSPNALIKEKLTFFREPVAFCTDAVRGDTAFTCKVNVWEIYWRRAERGTHASVGVATDQASLCERGYVNLVGADDESWGLDLVNAKLTHGGRPCGTYPPDGRLLPDTFYVVLDMDRGTMGFIANGVFLGPAFTGLKGLKLYPMVSSVWGQCQIKLRYLGSLDSQPHALASICRSVVRKEFGKHGVERMTSELSNVLPKPMLEYVSSATPL